LRFELWFGFSGDGILVVWIFMILVLGPGHPEETM